MLLQNIYTHPSDFWPVLRPLFFSMASIRWKYILRAVFVKGTKGKATIWKRIPSWMNFSRFGVWTNLVELEILNKTLSNWSNLAKSSSSVWLLGNPSATTAARFSGENHFLALLPVSDVPPWKSKNQKYYSVVTNILCRNQSSHCHQLF